MKKLKLLITISIINIMMFHFNIHWGHIFQPLKAYEFKNFGHPLAFKNNITYQILLIAPNTKIKINDQNRKLTFKSYDRENNRIFVVDGILDTTYDLSEIAVLSYRLDPDNLTLERLIVASGASLLGGAVGFGLGFAAETASNPEYMTSGGGAILGCMGGMAVSPVLYLSTAKGKWQEISLNKWSVQ